MHWQTDLVVSDVQGLAQRLLGAGVGFASSGAGWLPDAALGFREGALLAGPDGHALRLIGPRAPGEGG